MGQTPVTVEAYKEFVQSTGRRMPEPPYLLKNHNPNWSRESLPMTEVWWDAAHDYCEWAGLRLPSEAEWEYAARAGTTGARYGELDEIAWYDGNSGGGPHEVAQKRPNAFGLYDMLGNVLEWTADWYSEYKNDAGQTDPQGPPSGESRVFRGGCWGLDSTSGRASARHGNHPYYRSYYCGFRSAGEIRVP